MRAIGKCSKSWSKFFCTSDIFVIPECIEDKFIDHTKICEYARVVSACSFVCQDTFFIQEKMYNERV